MNTSMIIALIFSFYLLTAVLVSPWIFSHVMDGEVLNLLWQMPRTVPERPRLDEFGHLSLAQHLIETSGELGVSTVLASLIWPYTVPMVLKHGPHRDRLTAGDRTDLYLVIGHWQRLAAEKGRSRR